MVIFRSQNGSAIKEFGKRWPREFARLPPPQSNTPLSFDHKSSAVLYNVMAEAVLYFDFTVFVQWDLRCRLTTKLSVGETGELLDGLTSTVYGD